jgi:hypothetical protein
LEAFEKRLRVIGQENGEMGYQEKEKSHRTLAYGRISTSTVDRRCCPSRARFILVAADQVFLLMIVFGIFFVIFAHLL